jgi:hypothetical protein
LNYPFKTTFDTATASAISGLGLSLLQNQDQSVSTSAELKGGTTRNALRKLMFVENQSTTTNARIGSAPTTTVGRTLRPLEVLEIPIGDSAINIVSESGTITVRVEEWG